MKILIANDGSDFGAAAVDLAAKLIDPSVETHVKVVTVVVPAMAIDVEEFIESVNDLTDLSNPLARQADKIGAASAQLLREKFAGGNVVVTNEVLAGTAARAIVEKAEHWHADLIIVGSHGHGLWKRTLLGSVSDLIIHHAPCSVLVVRQPEGVNT